MKSVISYITRFLIGNNTTEGLSSLVGYTADTNTFSRYRVVIIPSPFFRENVYGKKISMPQLPLDEIEGVPLLFGSPKTEWHGDTWVVHADIIASAYFLLTRYEEIRKREVRDIHGRFPGKESLPYKGGFIHRPIVDEYGKLLRKWLRQAQVSAAKEPAPQIKKIWLTHDVDAPFFCRSFRNIARETIKGIGLAQAWKLYNGPIADDPFYTFPWLLQQGSSLQNVIGKKRCESIFFFKSSGSSVQDKPQYRLQSKEVQKLLHLCREGETHIGMHSSWDAGKNPSLIALEKKKLELHCRQPIRYNRHHYLSLREPEDTAWIEKAGITDDFTMGYADVAGFRLGTSRPVHWINPENKRISSSLLLHPLTLMDCSLSEPGYMNLSYEEALEYSLQLVGQVAEANGELVLLWHNDLVATNNPAASVNWQRKLFTTLIEKLKKA